MSEPSDEEPDEDETPSGEAGARDAHRSRRSRAGAARGHDGAEPERAGDGQRSGVDDADGEREVGDDERAESGDERDDGPSLGGIFGARPDDAPPRPDIRPESISRENAAFVVLGVLLALFVVYRAVSVLAV